MWKKYILNFVSYHTKNEFYIDCRPKYEKQYINAFREKTGENIYDLSIGKDFLNKTQKLLVIKEK